MTSYKFKFTDEAKEEYEAATRYYLDIGLSVYHTKRDLTKLFPEIKKRINGVDVSDD